MKNEDATATPTNPKTKRENSDGAGKGHYKFWVLAAIILLALWSMFTASLTLKWSAGNLTRDFDSTTPDDFDVLEVEEREKVVRRMWDVYTQSKSHGSSGSGLPRFWCDAFHAAYEHLVTDVRSVQDAAVSEIAKMSLRSLNLHLKSDSLVENIKGSRKMKQAESTVDTTVGSNQ
ncbi:hypothetical protein E2542_SST14779 [Spatholobus suberectus]|nr:hypothetical protein E2542_SST14779 [Spatholobus suberectus]